MQDTLLTVEDVIDILNVSRSTIYRWLNSGNFPAQHHIGPNTVRWKLSDIEKWQEQVCRS